VLAEAIAAFVQEAAITGDFVFRAAPERDRAEQLMAEPLQMTADWAALEDQRWY
jgi:hypothetical protein